MSVRTITVGSGSGAAWIGFWLWLIAIFYADGFNCVIGQQRACAKIDRVYISQEAEAAKK